MTHKNFCLVPSPSSEVLNVKRDFWRQSCWVTSMPTGAGMCPGWGSHSLFEQPSQKQKQIWPLCPAAMSLLPWCVRKKPFILLLTPETATAFPMCPPRILIRCWPLRALGIVQAGSRLPKSPAWGEPKADLGLSEPYELCCKWAGTPPGEGDSRSASLRLHSWSHIPADRHLATLGHPLILVQSLSSTAFPAWPPTPQSTALPHWASAHLHLQPVKAPEGITGPVGATHLLLGACALISTGFQRCCSTTDQWQLPRELFAHVAVTAPLWWLPPLWLSPTPTASYSSWVTCIISLARFPPRSHLAKPLTLVTAHQVPNFAIAVPR